MTSKARVALVVTLIPVAIAVFVVIYVMRGGGAFEGTITYTVASPHERLRFIRCTVKDSDVFVDRWDSGNSYHSDPVYLEYPNRHLLLVHAPFYTPVALVDTLVIDSSSSMAFEFGHDPAPTGRTASVNGYDAQEFSVSRGPYREDVWASRKPSENVRKAVAHLFDDNPACGNTGVFRSMASKGLTALRIRNIIDKDTFTIDVKSIEPHSVDDTTVHVSPKIKQERKAGLTTH